MSDSLRDLVESARTFLFVPGDRPERFAKAEGSGADLVVLDLEDAVASDAKNTARSNIREWLSEGHRAVVRVNSVDSAQWREDIEMVAGFDAAVMVPKSVDPTVLAALGRHNPVIALIETARGVLAAERISTATGVVRTALGHIDLAVELGVDPTDQDALLLSRTSLVLAAAGAGIPGPIDGVTTTIGDEGVLRADLEHARRLGLTAKLCIHPNQVAISERAFSPSEAEIAWAGTIVNSRVSAGGVAEVDGHMVDPPVVARAERILAKVRSSDR